MKRLKSLAIISVIVMLLITSFACNSKEKVTGVLPAGYNVNVSGEVSISTLQTSTQAEEMSLRAFTAAFMEKYPKTNVSMDFTVTEANTPARISAGDIGDVFFFWEKNTYAYAITHRALMPLEYYIESLNIDLADIYSGTLNMGMVNGKIYMVARDHTHVCIEYNKSRIIEEGLEPPLNDWTWEEFKDMCTRLTKYDGETITQVGAVMDFTYPPLFIPFLEGFGGDWCDVEMKTIKLHSDEYVLKGIEELVDFMSTGCLVQQGVTSGGVAGKFANDRANVVFRDTVFPGFSGLGQKYELLDCEWDIASFFKLPVHRVGAGATGYGVFNRTDNPDAAAALALFLYTPEGQRSYNGQIGGSVPNVKSLAEDTFWRVPYDIDSKNYEAFVSHGTCDCVGILECRMPTTVADIVKTGFASIFSKHFKGSKDFRDSLMEIETQATEKWQQLYD